MPRPEKNRTATGVDAVCTRSPDPMGSELDREKLYWELSHETHGVTVLGSYTLDKDSLYVNGEHPLSNRELKTFPQDKLWALQFATHSALFG